MFSLIQVIRKPAKGYHLGGYIVNCFCTRLGKQTGKLSDLPRVVTAHFMGEVLENFEHDNPTLAMAGVRGGNENKERDKITLWRNWCRQLRLAREVLPDGRASGKVKLVHSVLSLPGEICNELLEEGELEKEEVRNPVGVLWKGGVKMRVVGLTHVTHYDDEDAEGDGLKNDRVIGVSSEMRLPPSNVYNFLGNEYYMATLVGFKGGGYERDPNLAACDRAHVRIATSPGGFGGSPPPPPKPPCETTPYPSTTPAQNTPPPPPPISIH
jgi:hypothetical protein